MRDSSPKVRGGLVLVKIRLPQWSGYCYVDVLLRRGVLQAERLYR